MPGRMTGWRARRQARRRWHRRSGPAHWLGQLSLRGLTVTAGAAVGLAGLLALTLFGGLERTSEAPSLGPDGDRNRLGPLTAVQPDLREALLSEADLPAPTPTARVEWPAPPGTTQPAAAGPGRPAVNTWPPRPIEACRSLVEDPMVAALWPANPPRESTTGRTPRPDGATVHQVLAVFEDQDAPAAFGRLRETAAGCGEFPATVDGEPVTVVLTRLEPPGGTGDEEVAFLTPVPTPLSTTGPPTSPAPASPTTAPTSPPATAPPTSTPPPASSSPTPAPGTGPEEAGFLAADEAYQLDLTVRGESGTLTGWVALDRVGPAVSVLRRLGPQECSPEETIETRRAALIKLRQLLASRN